VSACRLLPILIVAAAAPAVASVAVPALDSANPLLLAVLSGLAGFAALRRPA
jgi:hypothetical protein